MRLSILGLFVLATTLNAQDGLSPITMDHVNLGADFDGRRSLCRVLIKATARSPDGKVTGCKSHTVVLAESDQEPLQQVCNFIRQRAGAVLYLDEKVVIRKGAIPTATADLQTRLERFNIVSVSGLLQSFDFTAVAAGAETVELHYNACP